MGRAGSARRPAPLRERYTLGPFFGTPYIGLGQEQFPPLVVRTLQEPAVFDDAEQGLVDEHGEYKGPQDLAP